MLSHWRSSREQGTVIAQFCPCGVTASIWVSGDYDRRGPGNTTILNTHRALSFTDSKYLQGQVNNEPWDLSHSSLTPTCHTCSGSSGSQEMKILGG